MQRETGYIELFLQTAYDDQRLAMLLAHAESGKLAFESCCCITGLSNAQHALSGLNEFCELNPDLIGHLADARLLPHAEDAEREFCCLVDPNLCTTVEQENAMRCELLIPIIKAEILRREELKAYSTHLTPDARERVVVA